VTTARPVLCVVGCAAPPVLRISELVAAAQARGWDTCLVLTPTAARWLEPELPLLATRTGHPVRSQYTLPGERTGQPPAAALLVAPATANTLSKCAAGISDTLALGLINEAICACLPLAMLPALGRDQAHPSFPAAVATLRGAGVRLLTDPPAGRPPAAERAGFPWHRGLDALPEPAAAAQQAPPGQPAQPGPAVPTPVATHLHGGWERFLASLRGDGLAAGAG
jgi:Flavoprotein